MMRKLLVSLIAMLIFCPSASFGEEVPGECLIRIGLAQNQTAITLQVCGTEERLVDLSSGTALPVSYEGNLLTFTWNGSQIVLNGSPVSAGPLLLKPGLAFLSWNNCRYRGEFIIMAINGRLTLVNRLPLEDYLKGVVPKEVVPTWPMASLKAQAVAARTYTVASFGRHSSEGFDLCATTHCQVYGGVDVETPATDQAVAETANQVMVYGGKIINALYHASGGGSTADPKNIWGFSPPYLAAAMDWDQNSPYYQWTRNIDWTQVQAAAGKSYPQVGRVYRVQPVSFAENGKVLKICLKGDLGEVTISSEAFRNLLYLPSSNIQLGIIYGPEPFIHLWWVHSTPYPEAVITANSSSGWGMEFLNPPWDLPDPWSWLQDKEPVTLVIRGYGWGHRIGLSQWGAKGMADAGFNERQILENYYPGIAIVGVEAVKN